MRILVVTDIHSNLASLEAVLAAAPERDMIWSLGDIVGYGPQPNECVALLNTFEHLHIPGNHDWGVLGKAPLDDFNVEARKAALWTRERITPEARTYLETAPLTLEQDDVTLAHGSPREPIWEYIARTDIAMRNFVSFNTKLCLVGHTHIPAIYWLPAQDEACIALQPSPGQITALEEGRYIINPGSVGQPRDGDPRAAYLLLDTDSGTVRHERVEYDIRATQKKMRAAALAGRNIYRLEYGF